MDNYSELHDESKVWVYQGERELNPYEILSIKHKLKQFVASWASHGQDVKAYGDIFYNRFIILIADETQASVSGCSIDSSINFIKSLEREFDLNFFNRLQIAYKTEEGIHVATLSEFAKMCKNGKINPSTVVFNNLVTTKREFETNWEVEAEHSWHSRYLNKEN